MCLAAAPHSSSNCNTNSCRHPSYINSNWLGSFLLPNDNKLTDPPESPILNLARIEKFLCPKQRHSVDRYGCSLLYAMSKDGKLQLSEDGNTAGSLSKKPAVSKLNETDPTKTDNRYKHTAQRWRLRANLHHSTMLSKYQETCQVLDK